MRIHRSQSIVRHTNLCDDFDCEPPKVYIELYNNKLFVSHKIDSFKRPHFNWKPSS